jgi:hypothetical protein
MTAPPPHSAPPSSTPGSLRGILEAALGAAGQIEPAALATMAGLTAEELDEALRAFAADQGAAALPVLSTLSDKADRLVRRAAKRALYRLAQRGVATPRPSVSRPVVERDPERPTRAWVSAVDGTGSRAAWILFQGAFGGGALCSLIFNDTVGIVEVAGGDITKKRFERELVALRASQTLPWVETDPRRAVRLIRESLARHAALGTSPPPGFARWQPAFAEAEASPDDGLRPDLTPTNPDSAALERSVALLDLPEFAGWFLDPEALQSDSVALLQTRESRLVVSDHIKAEREAVIVDGIIARELTPEARRRWVRRLEEMALILAATDRAEPATWAAAAAVALDDESREVRRHPLVLALTRRGLEMAAEVTLGRMKLADVRRAPGSTTSGR